MKSCFRALLAVAVVSVSGCSEAPPPSAPPAAAPEAPPAPPPAPVPLVAAPKANGRLTMIASGGVKAALGQPLDASAAASELVRRDEASNIAARCAPSGLKARKAHEETGKFDLLEADPLKIGMIPTEIPPALANQLTEKTRLWQLASEQFDFYKTLSDGSAEGLKLETPAIACIRYSLFRQDGGLYSDMLFSVTHNPKKPEILTIMPVRVFYRDFSALADQPGATQAAVKVMLEMHTYSIERTSGRAAAAMPNQEMLVELFGNPGAGQPLYQLYDPVNGPTATIPLPPWDFSQNSINPRHNLSTFHITVTEIADFDWLQSQYVRLWPGWEYAATDVSKLKLGAQYYSRTHMMSE